MEKWPCNELLLEAAVWFLICVLSSVTHQEKKSNLSLLAMKDGVYNVQLVIVHSLRMVPLDLLNFLAHFMYAMEENLQ